MVRANFGCGAVGSSVNVRKVRRSQWSEVQKVIVAVSRRGGVRRGCGGIVRLMVFLYCGGSRGRLSVVHRRKWGRGRGG